MMEDRPQQSDSLILPPCGRIVSCFIPHILQEFVKLQGRKLWKSTERNKKSNKIIHIEGLKTIEYILYFLIYTYKQ